MSNSKFQEIGQILREHRRFAILGHVRPDGDALGSQLRWRFLFKHLEKNCAYGMKMECWRSIPSFHALSCSPSRPPTPEDFDVAIALDTAIQNRLGTALPAVRSSKIWINIDHHASNPGYGDVVYVDSSAPATAEIIFRLIKSEGLPFNRDIAENLYAAISTDTGSFQYPKTSAHTFEIAAELIRTGLDVGRLSQLLYENYPRRRLELLRELLRTMRFQQEGHVASFSLTLKTAAELGVLPEDNEGLIDHLRAVRGVIVAVFFEELSDGKVRVSMRSKTEVVDVCAICQKFGGGGHTLAAGARVRGTLPEVEARVLAEVCAKIESLRAAVN